MKKITKELLDEIEERATDAAKIYGDTWDSSLVQLGPNNNVHAITSETTNDVVVSAADDTRESSWLCDYLESVSPSVVIEIVKQLRKSATQQPAAYLNDAHLARGHVEGEVGEEGDAPGMIPVYREPLGCLFIRDQITEQERTELEDYRRCVSEDREMLKRLAVILSGSDAPGEIRSLTVTAQSFVDRCKTLAKERDTLQLAGGQPQRDMPLSARADGGDIYRDLDEGFEKWYTGDACGTKSIAPEWFSEALKPVFLGTWRACRAAMLQGADGNYPVIPDGYAIVPIIPTEAMMLNGSGCQHHAWDDPDCSSRQSRRYIWQHMIEASQNETKQ